MGEIRKVIPVGFARQKEKQNKNLMPKRNYFEDQTIVEKEYEKALFQIGSLGGGNHFIEIQKGSDGYVWVTIHSGSRNFGLKIANYYNNIAIKLNERWHSEVPKQWELAFLPTDSKEGNSYYSEMKYVVEFALANRKLMMNRVKDIFEKETKCTCAESINIAHNYASLENHFGENVWIHRKGATLARKGTIGIIHGSMGTKSYIVEGLGNIDSFESCSHGAGRKMGRRQAIKVLNLKEEQEKMKGILGGPRTQNELDEALGSYKDISTVMKNQEDLVKILVELKPLAVIKSQD